MQPARASLVVTFAAAPASRLRLLWRGIQDRFQARKQEWYAALAMVVNGFVLLDAADTFGLAPYVVIRMMGSETGWALTFFAVGGLRMVVLGINGALPLGSPHLRALFAAISAVVWAVLLAGYWFSDFPSLMIGMTASIIPFEFVTIVQAAARAKDEDVERSGRNGHSG